MVNTSNKDIAIKVENISKLYRIGMKDKIHDSIASAVFDFIKKPLINYRKYRSLYKFDKVNINSESNSSDIIWALKDISFKVEKGEVLGIIGGNGAGKSTLLKLLSRVTNPTRGRAEIRGKVSSLLEVGTGFHQELTGRENIYLNGTILGMSKREIDYKFDDIIEFSGVEKFLDTPVKRYSSGMKVRLAFSVAAHLEPEILIIDEVLAVGDADFQRKCLGKMEDVAKGGRTVLFVSHNMSAIQALCSRIILLEEGHLSIEGEPEEVVKNYLSSLNPANNDIFMNNPERNVVGGFCFTNANVLSDSNKSVQSVIAGRPVDFEFRYKNDIFVPKAHVAMTIYNHLGVAVTNCNMNLTDFQINKLGTEGVVRCRIPNLPLPIGQYRVAVALSVKGQEVDRIPNAIYFSVDSSSFYNSGRTPSIRYSSCMVAHNWEHEVIKA